MRDTTTTPQAGGLAPDMDDILAEYLDIVFGDRMVEDLRTLDKISALLPEHELVATASGRLRKNIPYIFVGPPHRETLGRLALEILHSKPRNCGGLVARLRQLEMRLMAHTLKGDGSRQGDLLSYLYFDQEFIRASIELGQRDAKALFDGLPNSEVPWRIN